MLLYDECLITGEMASPRTRRVLKEVRVNDGNNVCILFYIGVCVCVFGAVYNFVCMHVCVTGVFRVWSV